MNEVERLMGAFRSLIDDAKTEYDENVDIAKRLVEHKNKTVEQFLIYAQEKCEHTKTERKVLKYIDTTDLFGSGDDVDDYLMYENICLICGKIWKS